MKIDSVAGRRVLVTGAAMGLGKLFAQRAVQEEAAIVVLWDVNEAALRETVAELEALGGKVRADIVDLTSRGAIAAAARAVREDLGGIDILVNNAGIVRGNRYFWENDDTGDIESTIAVNTLAPMYLTREFLPGMVAGTAPARVVTIASMAGFLVNPRMAAYCGSKWAAVGWSESVRLELAQAGHRHVGVTTVCPAYIDTGMFEGVTSVRLAPLLRPQDVVDAAWRGMKTAQPLVLLPWTSHLGRVASHLLPARVRDVVFDRLGLQHSMDQFRGRR
ncbi:SDR family NAD(P)-dependent oxidoreductase [Nocardia nova]|uniref:SDR family NAD(P)-dependent oxidoreductase n=1 Tax=Nocardia nova TaxID=37330 RepID=UPI003401386B